MKRLLAISFLLLVLAYVAGHWYSRVLPESLGQAGDPSSARFIDFDCYMCAAKQIQMGRSPYAECSTESPLPCLSPELPEYVYPPTFAFVLAGMERIASCRSETVWFAINVGLCFVLVPLLIHVCGLRWRPFSVAWVVFLVFAPMATLENVALGQVNLLVLTLILLSWMSTRSGGSVVAAGLLATAISIKITPVFFALRYAHARRIREVTMVAVLSGVLAGAPFLFLPSGALREFVGALSTKASTQLLTSNNASLHAAFARAFGASGEWSGRIVAAFLLSAAVGITWKALHRAREGSDHERTLAILLCGMVVISPQLEAHHLVFLYPCHLILAKRLIEPDLSPVRASLRVIGFAMILVLLNSRGLTLPSFFGETLGQLLKKPAGIAAWSEFIVIALYVGRLVGSRTDPEKVGLPHPPMALR